MKACASNVKVKVVSVDSTEAYHGSEGVTALILNLDTRWRWWSASRCDRFTPSARALSTSCVRCRVGPRTGVGALEKGKSYLCRESDRDSLVIWSVPRVTLLALLVCLSFLFLWFIMLTISWGTSNKVWLCGSLSPVVILVAQCSESVETLLAHFLTGPPLR